MCPFKEAEARMDGGSEVGASVHLVALPDPSDSKSDGGG
jgi:hypothetical protein